MVDRISRRAWMKGAVGIAVAGAARHARAAEPFVELPFANGRRPLIAYPQKRPLIVHGMRPINLETPFEVYNLGAITPNDSFFVRYHTEPLSEVRLDEYRLEVTGKVARPLSLTLAQVKEFDPAEFVAVNQCSGNGRGFSEPRVAGGQIANGAMGNARWTGVPVSTLLERAGVSERAVEVVFDGLDKPLYYASPDFQKSLPIDHAMNGEVILAWAMNGQDLPLLNGYPLRLVVPGYYGTYWMKHVTSITVLDSPFDGFYMKKSYRVPDNDCACTEPKARSVETRPISRLNVRSFITSHRDGETLRSGSREMVRGIAFDGGYGIREVAFSDDGGATWRAAQLGKDFGRYSFREWSIQMKVRGAGETRALKVRAVNRIGQSQPLEPLWNPAGYMRNVVETVKVNVT